MNTAIKKSRFQILDLLPQMTTVANDTKCSTQAGRENSKRKFRPRGYTIFREGDPAYYYYEIVSGTIRCSRTCRDGRRLLFRFACNGEMLALSGEKLHPFTAEALTDVVVRRFDLSLLSHAVATDGELCEKVQGYLQDELSLVRDQIMLIGRVCASGRLAAFLLRYSEETAGAGEWTHLPMNRSDIADYLGLTVETVSRKFSEFSQSGMVSLNGAASYRISNIARLRAIAGLD